VKGNFSLNEAPDSLSLLPDCTAEQRIPLRRFHWRTITYQVASRQPLIYDYTTKTHLLRFRRQRVPSGHNLDHRSLHISSTYANTYAYQNTQADGANSNAHFC
jgi:hypothetical protein